ncbi:MAG: type II toxin-antitoxin system RelE/ParE family toxin [Chitinophagaceae bacterium]|nr:type II toxin-antitoxin system RelE/ParE family toxin [Chitinophagaceae bacterium]
MGKQTKTIATAYKVRLSDNAVHNIDEITSYIAIVNHQPMNAVKVGDALFATIDQIELRPYAFKECDLLPTKSKLYRQALCLSWYIVYKIADTQIIVLGIIHGSRKPSKRKALKRVK